MNLREVMDRLFGNPTQPQSQHTHRTYADREREQRAERVARDLYEMGVHVAAQGMGQHRRSGDYHPPMRSEPDERAS
jgi:hypothetical protein